MSENSIETALHLRKRKSCFLTKRMITLKNDNLPLLSDLIKIIRCNIYIYTFLDDVEIYGGTFRSDRTN